MNAKPLPRFDSYFVVNEAIFLCPIIFVLLARKSVPIVLAYASVLFLILAGGIYLLMPSSLTGIDGPSMPLDTPTIVLYFVGILSGLGVIVAAPIILIHTLIKSFRDPEGAG
jgi:hypothetical protein